MFSPPELLPDGMGVRVRDDASGLSATADTYSEAKEKLARLVGGAERKRKDEAAEKHRQEHTPRETITIPLNVFGAAMFLSVLAYPNEARSRDKFMEAFTAWLARNARHTRSIERADASPFIGVNKREATRMLRKTLSICLYKRGSVATAYLSRLYIRASPSIDNAELASAVQTLKRWNLDAWTPTGRVNLTPFFEVIARLPSRHRHRDARNTGTEISHAAELWAETRPVLHLAIALFSAVNRLDLRDSSGKLNFLLLMDRWPQWLPQAIEVAEWSRNEICSDEVGADLGVSVKCRDTIKVVRPC